MGELLDGELATALAQARQAMQAGDVSAALHAYHQASLLAPQSVHVRLDLAVAFLAAKDPEEALGQAEMAAFHAESENDAGSWRISLVRGMAHRQLGRVDQAFADFHMALAAPALPDDSRQSLLQQCADIQLNAFGNARAAACLKRESAINKKPGLLLQAELAEIVADLYEGGRGAQEITDAFVSLGARFKRQINGQVLAETPRKGQRIRPRIGLISQQFCASPVGFLTLGVFRELSRHADLVFFDRGSKPDWAHAAYQSMARHWLPCAGFSAAQLLRLLAAADLDALIDLSGWTDAEALCAVATKPIRRQLKWVGGQAATTGLQCFDGMITDARQVPDAARALYTEPLLRAKHGYVTYQAPPYRPALAQAAACPPDPRGRPARGVYALVSHPAKISTDTVQRIQALKPKRLLLIDHRWRHQGTKLGAGARLGTLLDVAEFVTPSDHPAYLDALADLDAAFIDTSPYAMGLTAIELRLLGKHILTINRSPVALMCQRHAIAHLGARRFDHHGELASDLLQWCRAA
jgi:tetratricopeptide (TPR) repeat protein